MYSNRAQRVPLDEQQGDLARRPPDWECIRLFLEVSRRGSFRAAAEHCNLSINLLRRRIMELEHSLGLKLLTRHVTGIKVTPEGQTVLAAAAQMEAAAFGFSRAGERNKPIEGKVRLAVTEGLGTFWVVPRLVEFQRAYPRLLVDLACTMTPADVLRMEADLAIQLQRPTAPDVKAVRIGRMHIAPFAARSYIDTYGCPTTTDELLNHRVVWHMADQTKGQQLFEELFPGKSQIGFLTMVNNVSSAHYWAIAKGSGIGWLPTYAAAIGARVVPVNISNMVFPFDIWLTYHPEVAQIPRVRKLIDWVIKAFDPNEYPWFRDDYIHPDRLADHFRGGPQIANMFEGFLGLEAAS